MKNAIILYEDGMYRPVSVNLNQYFVLHIFHKHDASVCRPAANIYRHQAITCILVAIMYTLVASIYLL